MAIATRLVLIALMLLPGLARAQQAWSGYYPEGPVWIGQTLYWAEMGGDRVMSWAGGEPEVAWTRQGCGPTALARFRDDGFAVLCHYEGAVAVLDRDMRVLQMVRATANGLKLRNPNDVSADGQGGVWFTDPGPFTKSAGAVGAVYHLSAGGKLTRHAEGLFYGNGIHVDRQGWETEVGPGRPPVSSAYFWDFKNPREGAVEDYTDSDFVTADWKPHNYRVNRFPEWHLVDGIHTQDDGRVRPSMAAAGRQ